MTSVSVPDNKNVIAALYILAVKAKHTGRFQDFCRLNYRLFEDDWSTIEYGDGVDAVSDLFHSKQDRAVTRLIHKELIKRNYCYNYQEWNEDPKIRYYAKEAILWSATMGAPKGFLEPVFRGFHQRVKSPETL